MTDGTDESTNKNNINTENSNSAITANNKDNDRNIEHDKLPNKNVSITEKRVNTENTSLDTHIPTGNDLQEMEKILDKEDWSSLMFNSDDSLFNEWSKQMDMEKHLSNNKHSSEIVATQTMSSDRPTDTLPDIVPTGNKADAIMGLLMLGENINHIDDEINNEEIMPVNKPKQPDFMEEEKQKAVEETRKESKNNNNKDKKSSKENLTVTPSNLPPTNIKIKTKTKEFPSPTKEPGSPRGVLRVTCYDL